MFVTLVAILCSTANLCIEEIVTDSTMQNGLTFQGCMSGAQAPLAAWKMQHPVYRSSAYRIERYKCVPGRYEIQGRV